jgi:hypothetical protein
MDSRKYLRKGKGMNNTPSFLVHNKNNVNSQLYWADGLKTMWDFRVYKVRIGKTNIIVKRIADPNTVKILQAKWKSRYFNEGRQRIARTLRKRLGKYARVKGLMQTLTYDPKKVSKREAWRRYGKDIRRFLNAINQYRRRKGWQRLYYLWVVEVQKGTGYPHIHIFFPNLRWLAEYEIINNNWKHGRANLEKPKNINVSCAGYISKYLGKMQGWNDLHLALLWKGKCRLYGFSRGFFEVLEKKEPEWKRCGIVNTGNVDGLKQTLLDGGFIIEENKPRVWLN